MRIFALFILIFARTSWSHSEARCQLVDGIYANSSETIEDLKFESLVDIFSVNSAKNLSLTVKGHEFRFSRIGMSVAVQTKMSFLTTGNGNVRTAVVQLDRTPKVAFQTRMFYGNLILDVPIHDWSETEFLPTFIKPLTYNFYCSF